MELEITRDARLENLTALRQFVENACCQWGLSADDTFAITLAVDEACTNVVVHGYAGRKPGPIHLTIRREAPGITVTISDTGRRFDPDAVPVPDVKADLRDRQPGGLGIYLMRQLMDDVRYEFPPGQPNRLTLVKRIACPAFPGIACPAFPGIACPAFPGIACPAFPGIANQPEGD